MYCMHCKCYDMMVWSVTGTATATAPCSHQQQTFKLPPTPPTTGPFATPPTTPCAQPHHPLHHSLPDPFTLPQHPSVHLLPTQWAVTVAPQHSPAQHSHNSAQAQHSTLTAPLFVPNKSLRPALSPCIAICLWPELGCLAHMPIPAELLTAQKHKCIVCRP